MDAIRVWLIKVEIEGGNMKYINFGNREGKKLVILPGLSLKSVMGSAELIEASYAIFKDEYDVYLFDHIEVEPEGYTIRDMAEDTYEAINKLGLEDINLMGVSMGGMVSLELSINHPEMVNSLLLCSTTSRFDNKELFDTWKKYAEDKNDVAIMESFGENVYSPAVYEQNKDAIIESGKGASDQDFRNFIISIDAIENFDVYDELNKIKCPVLVLGADEDKVISVQDSIDMAEKLNCEYYIYEGYGHGVFDEAPDYRSRTKEFIDRYN